MPYPDNMNWPLYDATIGSTGGDENDKPAQFEPVTLSECDDCGELLLLNDIGLCRMCNDAAEAYGKTLLGIYEKNGGQLTEEAIKQINVLTAKQLGVL